MLGASGLCLLAYIPAIKINNIKNCQTIVIESLACVCMCEKFRQYHGAIYSNRGILGITDGGTHIRSLGPPGGYWYTPGGPTDPYSHFPIGEAKACPDSV